MLEPIIIPKLLIYFADFPYMSFVKHRAFNPLILMRFGTNIYYFFIRNNYLMRLHMMFGIIFRSASYH